MSEAEKIAGKLTQAQREAVLTTRESYRDEWVIPYWIRANTVAALYARGVAHKSPILGCQTLTPLGLEVRAILEKQS